MKKNINISINCKGTHTAEGMFAYVVQKEKIIGEIKLDDGKILKKAILLDIDEKAYICIDIKRAECDNDPLCCEDKISNRLLECHEFGKMFLLDDVLIFHGNSFKNHRYSGCVIHELNIERYDDFKLSFHGEEKSGVYYLTSGKEDAVRFHFWNTDVEQDFRMYCISYAMHVAKMLLIAGAVMFLAVVNGIWILHLIPAVILFLQLISLFSIPPKSIRDYRHIKEQMKNREYMDARMDDILFIARYGKKKKFTSFW